MYQQAAADESKRSSRGMLALLSALVLLGLVLLEQGNRGRVLAIERTSNELKKKAKIEDERARALRKQANIDYDKAEELLKDVGITTHWVGQMAREEASLSEEMRMDKENIKEDKRKLLHVEVLKKEIAKLKSVLQERQKKLDASKQLLASTRSDLLRDQRRHQAQEKNVARLLHQADTFADEAEKSLKRSQQLRLSSESSFKDQASEETAADDFQKANKLKRASSVDTRKALDARSKARLGQEYVAMLKQMVAKERRDVAVDRKLRDQDVAGASKEQSAVDRLLKEEKQLSRPSLLAEEAATKSDLVKVQERLKEEEAAVTHKQTEAKREQLRAMHLLHMSHKLQGKAADALAASTKTIQMEEKEA
ncbi:hypothetical protein GUITHDRAFT_165109 [Guillardia theta CCMP2712]|uniref:Uncharacterized protein n=1 Tax=Guillardia theta (strain CCMP2712) TaxID=905079 RepID=L1IR24_GUITC|nr:hypothetical protein GUITHDRAFT_165109 [Guillardia theta CCMP2712]EKX38731.1 hypothetical protein GUITHDRAFT_165109 [Guillardia theta CCMP2712]|eukprot:XP_005825711.1 hypothetical protein GUITHDRAFT_165109 [Guillardia theta CCMP2712]